MDNTDSKTDSSLSSGSGSGTADSSVDNSPPGDDNKDTNPHGDRPNFMYAWGESTFTEPVISPCPRGTANAESGSPPQQVSPESSQTLPAESTADATKNAGPGDAACGHPGGGIELDETDD